MTAALWQMVAAERRALFLAPSMEGWGDLDGH
jgi:hypothetical protein